MIISLPITSDFKLSGDTDLEYLFWKDFDLIYFGNTTSNNVYVLGF